MSVKLGNVCIAERKHSGIWRAGVVLLMGGAVGAIGEYRVVYMDTFFQK